MNTCMYEHPITEMITGVDIVEALISGDVDVKDLV